MYCSVSFALSGDSEPNFNVQPNNKIVESADNGGSGIRKR